MRQQGARRSIFVWDMLISGNYAGLGKELIG